MGSPLDRSTDSPIHEEADKHMRGGRETESSPPSDIYKWKKTKQTHTHTDTHVRTDKMKIVLIALCIAKHICLIGWSVMWGRGRIFNHKTPFLRLTDKHSTHPLDIIQLSD